MGHFNNAVASLCCIYLEALYDCDIFTFLSCQIFLKINKA